MNSGASRVETGRWLPDEARLVALVRDRGSDEWAAGVATGLADMVGRLRGRTFLINVAGAVELDRLLDAAGGPGLTSALTGAATVASVAHAPRGQKFAYLPAGEAALPYSALRRMERFRRFLRQARQGGGTLLLYVGEEDLDAAAGPGGGSRFALDGCIALGEAAGIATKLGAPLLARVERPATPPPTARGALASTQAAAEPDESGEAPAGTWTRMGSLTRLLLPAALLAFGVLGWVLIRGGPEGETPPPDRSVAAAGVEGRTSGPANGGAGEAAETAGPVDPAAGDPAGPGPSRAFSAPPARYSVLVASYIRLRDAMARRDELAEDGGLFYVAPTPVRGRVYYRVLYGAYEDRADAAAAMADLVAEGRKENVKEWDVRPVRLAYDLGTFAVREAADRRAASLHAAEIPAYVLRDTAEVPLYRVYAGAFSAEEDAEPLGERLADRDVEGQLISRAGIAP